MSAIRRNADMLQLDYGSGGLMLDASGGSYAFPLVVGALVLGYLLGSIPFGIILTRLFGAGDLRSIGSGNIGATNVLRTGRKGLAAATLVGDALKATLAIIIAAQWGRWPALAAALGAFLGHLFPLWLKFRGGKGVATFIGCLIGLNLWGLVAFAAIWLGVAFATGYSSLAALLASAATPFVVLAIGEPSTAVLFALLAILLWWKHADNLARLRAGTETRIGRRG